MPTRAPTLPAALADRVRARVPEPALAARREAALEAVAEALADLDAGAREPLAAALAEALAAPPRLEPDGPDVQLAWRGRGAACRTDPAGGAALLVEPDLGRRLEAAVDEHLRRRLDPGRLPTDPGALARLAADVRAARGAGRAAAAALEQLEAARRRAAAAPTRVVADERVACLDRLPPELWPDVLAAPALRAEWADLLEVELPDAPEAALEAARARPTLPVDTALLGGDLRRRVLAALAADADAAPDPEAPGLDGLLLRGDNADALRHLGGRFAGAVQCVYIDPPFNTASGAFAYPDREPSAVWLTAMEERLALATPLLRPDGTLYAHIDYHEKERLKLLLDRHLRYVTEVIWRIGWISGFKGRARKFVRNHDTIYQYAKGPKPLFHKKWLPYPEGYVRRDGKPPKGRGYPLEDTWNCSPMDRLDSIQIMSFSREKVGNGALTQKNENLLERIVEASSSPGHWVLDYYAGSGTTLAVAHKTGRRWVGVERAGEPFACCLARLKRVLFGDRYGISRSRGWTGGGAFRVLHLDGYAEALARGVGEA